MNELKFITSKQVEGCDHDGSVLTVYPRREVCNWYTYIFQDIDHCCECLENGIRDIPYMNGLSNDNNYGNACSMHLQNFKDYESHIHDSKCRGYVLPRVAINKCKICDELYDCCGRGDCGSEDE